MRNFLSLLACAVFPVAAAAQSFEAVNHLKVVPISATDFEVIEDLGAGPRGIWCAAADYAVHRFGGTGTSRIYVKSPRGRSVTVSGRKGVIFTNSEASLGTAPARSYSVTTDLPGVGLTVNHAIQFCRDDLIEPEDVLFPRPLLRN